MRPIEFTEDLALMICTRIADGEPLTRIAKDEAMPSAATVYRWIRTDAEFRAMYENARQDAAHTLVAEIIEIADNMPVVVEVDGQMITARVDMALVQANRLKVDARKWTAAKLLPRIYAEQVGIGAARDLPPLDPQLPAFEYARRMAFVFAQAEQDERKRAREPLRLAHTSS
jgi:hypothetical protein